MGYIQCWREVLVIWYWFDRWSRRRKIPGYLHVRRQRSGGSSLTVTNNSDMEQFWGPGNFELFVLAASASPSQQRDGQVFVIPFAKSATTGQHSPVRVLCPLIDFPVTFSSRIILAMPSFN